MALPAALKEPTGARGIGRIDRHAGIDALGLLPELRPGDQTAGAGKARHQRHVLTDAEFVDEPEILMHEGDRDGFGVRVDPTAADEDLAAVGLVDPGEDLDQGRFSRTVLTHERMDLALADPKVDPVQRERAEEALGEAADLDRRRRIGRHDGSFRRSHAVAGRPLPQPCGLVFDLFRLAPAHREGRSLQAIKASRSPEPSGRSGVRISSSVFVPFQMFT